MGKFILNVRVKSREKEKDWTFAHALSIHAVRAGRVPELVDLRVGRPWWRIQHQGDTGACIGYSMADGVLPYHLVKAKWIRPGDRLSPRFIWMAVKETDTYTEYPTTFIEPEGTEVKQALRVARKYGCVLEKDLPMSGKLSSLTMKEFYSKAAKLRIASYHNLGKNLTEWRQWLAWQGPIMVGLLVDRAFENCNRKNSRLLKFKAPKDPDEAGHAASLVGYGPDYFILRNSWGTGWGDRGYAYLSDDYARAAIEDAYGVVL